MLLEIYVQFQKDQIERLNEKKEGCKLSSMSKLFLVLQDRRILESEIENNQKFINIMKSNLEKVKSLNKNKVSQNSISLI